MHGPNLGIERIQLVMGWAIVFGTHLVVTKSTHTDRIHFAVHRIFDQQRQNFFQLLLVRGRQFGNNRLQSSQPGIQHITQMFFAELCQFKIDHSLVLASKSGHPTRQLHFLCEADRGRMGQTQAFRKLPDRTYPKHSNYIQSGACSAVGVGMYPQLLFKPVVDKPGNCPKQVGDF